MQDNQDEDGEYYSGDEIQDVDGLFDEELSFFLLL